MQHNEDDVLRSEFDLGFNYTRTYGPFLGRFFGGLKNAKLFGVKGSNGKVLCPPAEFDPETSEQLSEFVELAPTGVVASWSWVDTLDDRYPLNKPFAWALIKVDGADSEMLHAVDVDSVDQIRIGLPVKIRWRDERVGQITDIACFEPV